MGERPGTAPEYSTCHTITPGQPGWRARGLSKKISQPTFQVFPPPNPYTPSGGPTHLYGFFTRSAGKKNHIKVISPRSPNVHPHGVWGGARGWGKMDKCCSQSLLGQPPVCALLAGWLDRKRAILVPRIRVGKAITKGRSRGIAVINKASP